MTAPWSLGWLLRLQHAATTDEAQVIARDALNAGASPADVAASLIEWELLRDAETVRIGDAS